jgi:hypothetical protein
VKLGFVEDDVLQLIVVVEGVDGRPEGEGINLLFGLVDDVQHLQRVGRVDPVDDATADLVPVSVTVDDRVREEMNASRLNLLMVESKNMRQSM